MRITDSQINMGAGRQYFRSNLRGNGFSENRFSGTINPIRQEIATNEGKNQPSLLQTHLLASLLKRLSGTLPGFTNTYGGSSLYEEYEETAFETTGLVHTADGRSIDFRIHLHMSRSYMEYTKSAPSMLQNALCDPLVVHMDRLTGGVSNQTFSFDLDADGTKDRIPLLSKGSGFPALDLNDNGTIDDGKELFGTESGNGFADLRAYDSDGNGWIDEEDAIFSKLKVWCKNDAGEDILMDLKEAGIGAMYLGSASTEHSLYNGNHNLNGVIRQTGFFLYENGLPGTMQHIDLAKNTESDAPQKEPYITKFTYTADKSTEKARHLRNKKRLEALQYYFAYHKRLQELR